MQIELMHFIIPISMPKDRGRRPRITTLYELHMHNKKKIFSSIMFYALADDDDDMAKLYLFWLMIRN